MIKKISIISSIALVGCTYSRGFDRGYMATRHLSVDYSKSYLTAYEQGLLDGVRKAEEEVFDNVRKSRLELDIIKRLREERESQKIK